MPTTTPTGRFAGQRLAPPQRPAIRTLADAIRHGSPGRLPLANRLSRWQRQNRDNFERSLHDQAEFEAGRLWAIGHLWVAVARRDGRVQDYGLVSCRVVTTAGVGFIVDAFQNLVEMENMKFHGIGTGSTAEAASQTALVTELTTQYSVDNTRPTGTTSEQSGNANVYETVATVTVDSAVTITEHGIFSQAATGGGVMLDRSVFTGVPLGSAESMLCTYRLTFPSGG